MALPYERTGSECKDFPDRTYKGREEPRTFLMWAGRCSRDLVGGLRGGGRLSGRTPGTRGPQVRARGQSTCVREQAGGPRTGAGPPGGRPPRFRPHLGGRRQPAVGTNKGGGGGPAARSKMEGAGDSDRRPPAPPRPARALPPPHLPPLGLPGGGLARPEPPRAALRSRGRKDRSSPRGPRPPLGPTERREVRSARSAPSHPPGNFGGGRVGARSRNGRRHRFPAARVPERAPPPGPPTLRAAPGSPARAPPPARRAARALERAGPAPCPARPPPCAAPPAPGSLPGPGRHFPPKLPRKFATGRRRQERTDLPSPSAGRGSPDCMGAGRTGPGG
ncbi:basic proline-rich protein-like [Panthera tigris]|uniref:basic proline-rich protein-like n=1 Tax=Panthera tigris TaxID=9694 RepID=UPI001C6FB49E|nr:basic proline-rich protein-like [Panthera tigris]